MKTYLSDHARLVNLEYKIEKLAAILHQYIVSSDPVTLPLNQIPEKVGDFSYTLDEILQAMGLRIGPDDLGKRPPRKVTELAYKIDAWKHYSEK